MMEVMTQRLRIVEAHNMKKIQRIMVGIDGSDQSFLALNRGIELAKLYKASLLLVTIEEDSRFIPLMADGTVTYSLDTNMIKGIRYKVKLVMRNAVKLAKEQGVTAQSLVYYGNARTELARELPTVKNIDLIILGATGLNRFEQMVIGSNANYVVAHAKCNVLLVR